MVTTTEILPCLALQPFIRSYTLREFDTGGTDFIKPLPANHEITLSFMLSGDISSSQTNSADYIAGARQHIIGLQTASKGSVVFSGNVKLFTVHFKPNGFYHLFRLPPGKITDNIYKVANIKIKGIDDYDDQLNEYNNFNELKTISDNFFLSHLAKSENNDLYNSITSTSSIIFNNNGIVNIKALAADANMSLRTFENRFAEQVGVPPKLFARITRFNYALLLKMKNMSKSWTDICHDCGYYDQMHFIKEFKQFAGDSPLNFYKTTPLPLEDIRRP